MKTNKCSLWKIGLLAIVMLSLSTKANAQLSPIDITQTKILSPIVKLISEAINDLKSEIKDIEWNTNRDKSYLNSSLFLFKENIQLCKDIINSKNEILFNREQKIEIPAQIRTDSTTTTRKVRIVLKKKKSFWNHPGNTKTSI